MGFFVGELLGNPDGKVFSRNWQTSDLVEVDVNRYTDNEWIYNLVLWLDSEAALKPLAQYNPQQLHCVKMDTTKEQLEPTTELLVWVEDLPVPVVKDLLGRRCILRAWLSITEQPERYGVFFYEHGEDFENWIAGPYVKLGEPAKPIKLPDLPQAIRREFGQFKKLEVDFVEDAAIQPAEHLPCSVYGGDRWVDLNGKKHRLKR